MADGLVVSSKQREFKQECKEFAANASCSVILVVVALVLLRPLMVSQILSRADAYSAVGQFDESKRQCDKALLIDNESSHAWHQQARLSKTLGDRESAYKAYQKATEADSTNWQAHFEVGMMYIDDGRYQAAIPYFEQVRKLGVEKKGNASQTTSYHRDTLDMLALCYEKVGDFGKMEFTLEEMRIFYPGHGNAEARLNQLKENHPSRSQRGR
jgi:tetratricopeptide (TPR) repeat protein